MDGQCVKVKTLYIKTSLLKKLTFNSLHANTTISFTPISLHKLIIFLTAVFWTRKLLEPWKEFSSKMINIFKVQSLDLSFLMFNLYRQRGRTEHDLDFLLFFNHFFNLFDEELQIFQISLSIMLTTNFFRLRIWQTKSLDLLMWNHFKNENTCYVKFSKSK